MSSEIEHLNPFQHALQRPDAYIGSKETIRTNVWVFDLNSESPRFINREIDYNPGLERIFVEIMSNAIDNKWRSDTADIHMKSIDFTLDPDTGSITVRNDGYCIPISKKIYKYIDHRTGKTIEDELYAADLCFGEMHSGSNFNDDVKRKTSGRNGMGAKATNVFSTYFEVDHTDTINRKRYHMIYKNNSKTRTQPKITSYSNKTGYTSITFIPDYKYFGYKSMDADLISLITKHVYDCAMITGLKVTLNGEKIIVKNLVEYSKLYPNITGSYAYLKCDSSSSSEEFIECVYAEMPHDEDTPDQQPTINSISFINGIYTKDGGCHVDVSANVIFPHLVKAFNADAKHVKSTIKVKAKELYPYFMVFVRAEAYNTRFSSQTKDYLTAPKLSLHKDTIQKWLSTNIDKIMKWEFIHSVEDMLLSKKSAQSDRKSSKTIACGDSYLEANWAGDKELWKKTTLYITEGKSAKTGAISGYTSLPGGSDKYGSLAIRGKFLNVENASKEQISKNLESSIIKQVLGLRYGVDYTDNDDGLQYGRVCIFTDQDDDGFHIRGLLLLFFYKFWPGLFKRNDYITSHSTAVIKVMFKTKHLNELVFFSNPEFKEWERTNKKSYTKKYFKGIGSHDTKDIKPHFKNQKIIRYFLEGDDEEYMKLGFYKNETELRKMWITRSMIPPNKDTLCVSVRSDENDGTYQAALPIEGNVSLSLFVDAGLIVYHKASLPRGIPSLYDGFKESQRKIFFSISAEKVKQPAKFGNLMGAIQKRTVYEHATESIGDTMTKMGQSFIGSNNIPLLLGDGQFGTRLSGGDDAASPRYLHTMLTDISKVIFNELDEPLLRQQYSEDKLVEYMEYMPIIPMILVNGAQGIACGFSTTIPQYNPLDIVEWIRTWLLSPDSIDKVPFLKPWCRGFKGEVKLLKPDKSIVNGRVIHKAWQSRGILEKRSDGWWHITELPIGMWTDTFNLWLEYLTTGVCKDKKKKSKKEVDKEQQCLSAVRRYPTSTTVHYMIKPKKDFIPDMDVKGNMDKLVSTDHLTNMIVLDENGYPRRYECPENLLEDFCKVRLTYYIRRKEYVLKTIDDTLVRCNNKYIFIKAIVEKRLDIHQSDEELDKSLTKLNLDKINDSYSYLLSMQINSLTKKKMAELEKEIDKLTISKKDLESKSPQRLWLDDLDSFLVEYSKFLESFED